MDKIQNIAFELHDKLLASEEYKQLKEKEKIMLSNPESSFLLNNYQELLIAYNDNKSNENLKKLHVSKLKLDENNLVKEYKDAYKNYQILVGNITDIVFDGFKTNSVIDKIIRTK